MTKLARLLTVSLLAVALAPASPLGVADSHAAKAKKERTAKKSKKAKKPKRSTARTTISDPGTTVTDPGTTVTDPGTTIPEPTTGNPAQQCKAERAEDPDAFAEKHGTNRNKANAFGKCVSDRAHAKKQA